MWASKPEPPAGAARRLDRQTPEPLADSASNPEPPVDSTDKSEPLAEPASKQP